MRERYDQLSRVHEIAVVISLFFLTLRFYVRPEGTPELGFPKVRALLDRGFVEYGFDVLLFYGIRAVAVLAIVHFMVSLLLMLRRAIAMPKFLESAAYSAVAVGLPFFYFGYAMAHTKENLVLGLTAGWLITSFLWMVSLLCRSRKPI